MKNSEKRASPSAATVLRSREIIAPGVLERMGRFPAAPARMPASTAGLVCARLEQNGT